MVVAIRGGIEWLAAGDKPTEPSLARTPLCVACVLQCMRRTSVSSMGSLRVSVSYLYGVFFFLVVFVLFLRVSFRWSFADVPLIFCSCSPAYPRFGMTTAYRYLKFPHRNNNNGPVNGAPRV